MDFQFELFYHQAFEDHINLRGQEISAIIFYCYFYWCYFVIIKGTLMQI